MKRVLLAVGALLLVVAAAMSWQHLRYTQIRREVVHDRQPLLYGPNAFHVVTFLRTASGDDAIQAVRELHDATAGLEGLHWVYAGKVALDGALSSQLDGGEWSAVTLLQFPSRAVYEEVARTGSWRQALARFEASYSHGFERPVLFNLAIHQMLGARRVAQLFRREPSNFPFEPTPDDELPPVLRERLPQLLAESELGANAAVVFNLIRSGNAEQREKDAAYVSRMMAAMAEGGYGPMHMGRAVPVEGSADFDRVAVVFYPGVEFFGTMVRSRFFQGIIGDKQLGDTQASVTVPILQRL